MQQAVFVCLGPLMSNLPLIFCMVAVVVFFWLRSVLTLDKLYHAKLRGEDVVEEGTDAPMKEAPAAG